MAVAVRTTGTSADLSQLVAHRDVSPRLLDAMLDLFDGHDVTATWWARGRRPGFYKQPDVSRRIAFKAHLAGVVMVGAYPFRGVYLRCGCEGAHVCEGGGTHYLCIDLDAKKGEGDIRQRVGAVLGVCRRFHLLPLTATSRSAKGAHVYVFLDRRVTTAVAHAAGRVIAQEAGVWNRCDVIPSPGHAKGFGTLHALPLSPLAESGGGLVLDQNLRPITDSELVTRSLRWADSWRSDARTVEALAKCKMVKPVVRRAATPTLPAGRVVRHRRPLVGASKIIAATKKYHPQFRKALATPVDKWRGGRSSRDAYLVGYLRRQGLTAEEIASALVAIPDTKAAERGFNYALSLAKVQEAVIVPAHVPLAGTPLPPQPRGPNAAQRSDLYGPPWYTRVAPPKHYGDVPNPWWRPAVQSKLISPQKRSKADPVVLAYIVDRYFRGPISRRMFFASRRGIGRELGMTARAVGGAVKRLAVVFPDIIRVVPGVPHPHLRLATAFYVVDPEHRDSLDWYVRPGRSDVERLSCHRNEGSTNRNAGPGPEDVSSPDDSRPARGVDVDAARLHVMGEGAVLLGESRLDAHPEGLLVSRSSGTPERDSGRGLQELGLSAPARDEDTRHVRGGQVSGGPAQTHRGSPRGRRRQRAWRTPRSVYEVG